MWLVARLAKQQLLVLAVALGVAVVALVLALRGSTASGPPFSLAAMHARVVNLTVIADNDEALATVQQLAGKGRLNPPLLKKGQALVVGQLDFTDVAPTLTDGQMAFFVIDRRNQSPYRLVWGIGPAGTGSRVAQGWDSRYQRLPQKYEWLRMLAVHPDEYGNERDPMAVGWRPATRGPVTFEAVVARDAFPITDLSTQLTFALAYVGDERGAWAVHVPVSG